MANKERFCEITSVGDFLNEVQRRKIEMEQKVYENNECEEENKLAVDWFFRGQGNFDWSLEPGLFRKICWVKEGVTEAEKGAIEQCLPLRARTLFEEEQFLIQETERYCPEAFTLCKKGTSRVDLASMAVAQHYETPTRLLDVSSNALVALYFAVAEDKYCNTKDASVFIFRANSDQYQLASTGGCVDVSVIQDSALHLGRPLLVFPPFVTERQRAQSGSFIAFGENDGEVQKCEPDGEHLVKIRIPLAYKKNLRRELSETCGIFHRTLFPKSENPYKESIVRTAKRRVVARALASCPELQKYFDIDV